MFVMYNTSNAFDIKTTSNEKTQRKTISHNFIVIFQEGFAFDFILLIPGSIQQYQGKMYLVQPCCKSNLGIYFQYIIWRFIV